MEKSKHPIADMVFSLFCYFIALVIGGIGFLFYFLFGPFLFIGGLITGFSKGFSGGFSNAVVYGFVFILFGGFLIRISQACGHGEFGKLFSLKYWMGKEETFKF
ncbi:MAG: hypothetical protein VYC05_05865 [Verrucomicrobiota bacterium]|nr:hypothetical protein [Verrucomicrobiota bacterium]